MKHPALKIAAFALALAVPAAWAQAAPLSVAPKTLALTDNDGSIVQAGYKKWHKHRYHGYRYGHRHRYRQYGYYHRRHHWGPGFSFGFSPYYAPYYGYPYGYYGWGPSFTFRIH